MHAENWCISSLTLGISHPNLHQASQLFPLSAATCGSALHGLPAMLAGNLGGGF